MLLKWECKAKTNAVAQLNLGTYYFTRFPEMTRWWYTKSAEQGHPEANFRLGFCYEVGHAVKEQSFEKAKELYIRAAKKSHTGALNTLGAILRYSDPDLAFEYFKSATIRGNLDAMCNIGLCYLTGIGASKNYTLAVRHFTAAAEHGHYPSLYHLGNCAALGLGFSSQLSLAFKYWSLAAVEGHCPESSYFVGRCFYDGTAIPQNYDKAFEWFCISARRGNPFASFWEGFCYRKGHGTISNETSALDCFNRAARQGQKLVPELKEILIQSLNKEGFDASYLDMEEDIDETIIPRHMLPPDRF